MSVGHVARILEENGIATVIIGIRAFQDTLEAMTVPRLLATPHMMGRTLGPPGDVEGQRVIIRDALELLEKAERAGTIVQMAGVYHPR